MFISAKYQVVKRLDYLRNNMEKIKDEGIHNKKNISVKELKKRLLVGTYVRNKDKKWYQFWKESFILTPTGYINFTEIKK